MKKFVFAFVFALCLCSVSWAAPLPEKIVLMNQELTLKDQQGNAQQGFIAEYIPQGETWDNWRLLFAVRFIPGTDIDLTVTTQEVLDNVLKKKTEGDVVANGRILSNPQNGLVAVDFLISNLGTPSKELFLEHNVFVYSKVPKGIVSYQLARRVYEKVDSQDAIEKFIIDIPTLVGPMITELSKPPVKLPFNP